jgi:hypothetical protein
MFCHQIVRIKFSAFKSVAFVTFNDGQSIDAALALDGTVSAFVYDLKWVLYDFHSVAETCMCYIVCWYSAVAS